MSETMSEVSEIKTENPVVPLPSDSVVLETPKQERIENIFGMLIRVTTTPNWVPKSFYEGFAVDTTNNRFYWYDFTDNAWNYTESVTKITNSFTVGESLSANDAVIVASGTMVSNTITNTTQNSNFHIYGTNWVGQTFTTSANTASILGVKLRLAQVGALNTASHIFIYPTSGGVPTGGALVDLSSSPTIAADVDEYTFTFSSPVAVSPSTTYALVVDFFQGDSSNYIACYYNSSSVYAGGTYISTSDSGANWSADADKDLYFKIEESYHTAGRIYKANSTLDNELATNFVGFVSTSGTAGDSVVVSTWGAVSGFTGLTKGVPYYISTTSGLVSTTPAYPSNVGVAISTTEIFIGKQLPNQITTTASDYLKTSADTERNNRGNSYGGPHKSIGMNNPGTIRVTFDLRTSIAGNNAYGKIYINGVAVGTERNTTLDTYTNYSEDFTVNESDNVQLWTKTVNVATEYAYIRNFRIYYTKGITNSDTIITN